ncbi:MAG: VOC family protein [Acidiferrobacterales bacterium]
MTVKIEYLAIPHVGVLVTDIRRALEFYRDALGFVVDAMRPDLGFPGAWLKVGNQHIHLLELPNPDSASNRPDHAGRDRHIAISVRDIAPLHAALEFASIAYTRSQSGRRALFCRDPDGNGIEFVEDQDRA